MLYSICYCKKKKKERAVFHITFAPWSQNIAYRPSCFLGHMSSAAKLFPREFQRTKSLSTVTQRGCRFLALAGPEQGFLVWQPPV